MIETDTVPGRGILKNQSLLKCQWKDTFLFLKSHPPTCLDVVNINPTMTRTDSGPLLVQ